MASELVEVDLYNGQYHVVHNPKARGSQPRYVVTDGTDTWKPQGVTTILGATLSKDLMQWAVDCGIELLTDRLKDNGGIAQEDLDDAAQEYINKRDSGAGVGTETHMYVEQYLKKQKFSLLTATAEAQKAYRAFVNWFEKERPEVVSVESVIYSGGFQFAGTYDCLLNIKGKNILCDLKTTNVSRKAPQGIYAEFFIQLGAYAYAHEEQRKTEEQNGGTDLVPIDDLMVISAKKNGQLDTLTASELGLSVAECSDLFLQVISLHRFLKEKTKQLGGR
jgi:hypothetical protein